MLRCRVTAFVMALATLLTACASLPLKEHAVRTLDSTERLLAQVQDTERRLCHAEAFLASPSTPILVCAGPLSEITQLTTARHQRFAAGLGKAFDAQIKAAIVLKSWRAGDPPPATMPELLDAIAEVQAVVKELSPHSDLTRVLETLVAVRTDLDALMAAWKGATE